MDFEQRIQRLTERHEALTQTVELMARMHQDDYRKHEEDHRKNQVLMAQIMESIHSLTAIVHSHERRISDLEA